MILSDTGLNGRPYKKWNRITKRAPVGFNKALITSSSTSTFWRKRLCHQTSHIPPPSHPLIIIISIIFVVIIIFMKTTLFSIQSKLPKSLWSWSYASYKLFFAKEVQFAKINQRRLFPLAAIAALPTFRTWINPIYWDAEGDEKIMVMMMVVTMTNTTLLRIGAAG